MALLEDSATLTVHRLAVTARGIRLIWFQSRFMACLFKMTFFTSVADALERDRILGKAITFLRGHTTASIDDTMIDWERLKQV